MTRRRLTSVVEGRGLTAKVGAYAGLDSARLTGRVLDVGCRNMELALFVRGTYVGTDLSGAPDVRSDLGAGLPFDDRTFDAVVALDVVEHVDDAHAGFDELCRVAARQVLVALPNGYVWTHRLAVVRGRPFSGKYGLPSELPGDRHRWFFSYADARDFVHHRAAANGFRVAEDGPGFNTYRRAVPRALVAVGRRLGGKRFAGVLACRYWAVLERAAA